MQLCQWVAKCRNVATGIRDHPVYGQVPICTRCDDKAYAPLFQEGVSKVKGQYLVTATVTFYADSPEEAAEILKAMNQNGVIVGRRRSRKA